MDAPEVRYARAEDGANIAYSTLGDRSHPAIMVAPCGVSHLTLEWEIETVRNWLERLARRFFVVRYDARGSGLSQADGVELSLAGYAGDIGAVASSAGLERYVLYANAAGSAPAVLEVLERPETISHFVLAGPQVDPSAYGDTSILGQITSANWPYVRKALSTGLAAGASNEVAKQWSNVLDAATDGERYQRWLDMVGQWTVEQELPRVGSWRIAAKWSWLRATVGAWAVRWDR